MPPTTSPTISALIYQSFIFMLIYQGSQDLLGVGERSE